MNSTEVGALVCFKPLGRFVSTLRDVESKFSNHVCMNAESITRRRPVLLHMLAEVDVLAATLARRIQELMCVVVCAMEHETLLVLLGEVFLGFVHIMLRTM